MINGFFSVYRTKVLIFPAVLADRAMAALIQVINLVESLADPRVYSIHLNVQVGQGVSENSGFTACKEDTEVRPPQHQSYQ